MISLLSAGRSLWPSLFALYSFALCLLGSAALAQPQPVKSDLFPFESWHNHSSSITELPNGDLFAVWFHGSGERTADDVKVEGAWWRKATGKWTPRFTVADTPGFPDVNCVVWVDNDKRLWLLWPVILANTWESATMKYRITSLYAQAGDSAPKWEFSDNIFLIPNRIAEKTKEVLEKDLKRPNPFGQNARALMGLAEDKLFSRQGWFSRTHPLQLPSGRILVPLYSDGYSFGIMAISDDKGLTWHASEPIVGYGGIQPSVVRKNNGHLVAYLRDNGPAPKRVQRSISTDQGETWTGAEDTDVLNPGSSLEVIRLQDGRWLMAVNDTEKERNQLALYLSTDEGQSWTRKRFIENGAGRYHYPSLIQTADGRLHLSYSVFEKADNGEKGEKKTIRHTIFTTAWLNAGTGN